MKKLKTHYVCQECGKTSLKEMGRCTVCGAWNSYEEEAVAPSSSRSSAKGRAAAPSASKPIPLLEAPTESERRLLTGIGEFDRVLGGGLVPGSGVLIGGEPGVGKSTLLMQAASALADSTGAVLYTSGEESVAQLKRRADRIGLQSKRLYLLAETDVDAILHQADQMNPAALIVDSIQTAARSAFESAPGSVTQARESASAFLRHAKGASTALLMTGHVTKEGAFAGPKMLEHMVDAALNFEGENNAAYRIVRAVKNRFGSTNEIGVFEMRADGLFPVENPSALFMNQRSKGEEGSAVACVMNGSRPIFIEAQALAVRRNHGNYAPFRVAGGINKDRVSLLIAILEKRGGIQIHNSNVFVNVTGGLRVNETGADLAALMALASSCLGKPVPSDTAFIGEAGLGGEIRAVGRASQRFAEAARLGFKRVVASKRMAEGAVVPPRLEFVGVSNLREALSQTF